MPQKLSFLNISRSLFTSVDGMMMLSELSA